MARKRYTGEVVSDKMDKTVVVSIMRLVQHTRYKKTIKKTTRFMAHDEHNLCKSGDKVSIVESRPLSRRKRWTVLSVNGKTIQELVGEKT